jgi:hypothetical protein
MNDIPIHTIRTQKVILDSDLAEIYGVSTKVFNQAVKRNEKRFPDDFRFQLTQEEYAELLRSQNVTLKRGQHRKYLPYVFTEHGALQAGNILNSEKATEMSVYVVRTFVKMRQELLLNNEILKRLAEHDKKFLDHDKKIGQIVRNLLPLLEEPPTTEKPPIGFNP